MQLNVSGVFEEVLNKRNRIKCCESMKETYAFMLYFTVFVPLTYQSTPNQLLLIPNTPILQILQISVGALTETGYDNA